MFGGSPDINPDCISVVKGTESLISLSLLSSPLCVTETATAMATATATSRSEFIYETLNPLSLFAEFDSDPIESYAVFRNEITSAARSDAEIPAVDFFSLDVSVEKYGREEAAAPIAVTREPERNQASERVWYRAGSSIKSPMLQLHKEILDFCDFVSPTPEEQASRNAAVKSVFEVVKYIWPHCEVEVFGSFRTGLYLPTSDVDVVIMKSKVVTPQSGLYALSRALSQKGIARNLQVIPKARVPIVKFVEKQSGIAFDISFDMESGPAAADFIKNALKKFPPLRPLCLILKVFLQQRELNEVYSGGVGSYALLSMLIAYLQIHWGRLDLQRIQEAMEHNLAILLVNFFDFYGRKLNTKDVGVSCISACPLYWKSDRGFFCAQRPFLLSIEDPQDPHNDIGRNSFNYFKVRSAFSMAYSSLTDVKAIVGLGQQRSILGTIIRPDPILLNRRSGEKGDLTYNSLLPGAGEPAAAQQQQQQFGDERNNMLYNWHLSLMDDDEPLPREKVVVGEDIALYSRKSRASWKTRKAPDDGGETRKKSTGEENGCRRDGGAIKRKRTKGFRVGVAAKRWG